MELDDDPGGGWLRLCADDWSAVVSVASLRRHQDSLLAGLADAALAAGRDALRLDASADVAREVVAVLRLRDSYRPPADARLAAALRHTLDFLGVPAPPALPAGAWAAAAASTAAAGWAVLHGPHDPRPPPTNADTVYVAAPLPARDTGAGEDFMLVAGTGSGSCVIGADSRAARIITACESWGPCVGIGGRAYVLGCIGSSGTQCYDPAADVWFAVAPPPSQIYDFAAAAPTGGRTIVAAGGVAGYSNGVPGGAHRSDVLALDTRARAWSAAPAGASLPRPSRGLAAAALDDHRVLFAGGSAGREAHVLDLRTWRCAPAGALRSPRVNAAAVAVGGRVLLLGGCCGETNDMLDSVEAFDAAVGAWADAGTLPLALSSAAPVVAQLRGDVPRALRLDSALGWRRPPDLHGH
ncbi:Klhl23 [Scenedesmus sp. PABB004]|nr:Klhl23 [Scenedesmus sp. PABB004]